MVNHKTLKVGDKLVWMTNEFGIKRKTPCEVTQVFDDHALAEGDGMRLWIENDFSAKDFYKEA